MHILKKSIAFIDQNNHSIQKLHEYPTVNNELFEVGLFKAERH